MENHNFDFSNTFHYLLKFISHVPDKIEIKLNILHFALEIKGASAKKKLKESFFFFLLEQDSKLN